MFPHELRNVVYFVRLFYCTFSSQSSFQLHVVIVKPKQLLQPITVNAISVMSQSELRGISFSRRQARENTFELCTFMLLIVQNVSFSLLEERDIALYCDLHGHSRKQNVFIYGCENRLDPLKRLRERVFPVMMSKNAPNKVWCCYCCWLTHPPLSAYPFFTYHVEN